MRSDSTVQLRTSCTHDCRVGRSFLGAGSPANTTRNDCAYYRHSECNARRRHICLLPIPSSFSITTAMERPPNPELRPAVLVGPDRHDCWGRSGYSWHREVADIGFRIGLNTAFGAWVLCQCSCLVHNKSGYKRFARTLTHCVQMELSNFLEVFGLLPRIRFHGMLVAVSTDGARPPPEDGLWGSQRCF
jgi:hypothetical protein